MIKAIRRWWFCLWHPEWCRKCGGSRTFHTGPSGRGWWQCATCWKRQRIEVRERAMEQRRKLFG